MNVLALLLSQKSGSGSRCCYIMADHLWAQQSCVMRSDLQGWTMSTHRHAIAIVDSLDFAVIGCYLECLKHLSTDKVFYYH